MVRNNGVSFRLKIKSNSISQKLKSFLCSGDGFATVQCLILLCFCQVVIGQTGVSKKTYTTDSGLAHNYVQGITQDKSGFLWISTWDGLSRFDGYEFKNYYHKPDDPHTFPFFIVEKTAVDRDNNLWVICPQRQVVRYDRINDRFIKFIPEGYSEFRASDIVVDRDDKVWFLCEELNSLYGYDLQSEQISKFQMVDEFGNDNPLFYGFPISELKCDNKGNFWFISYSNKGYEVFKGTFTGDSKIRLKRHELPRDCFKKPTSFRKPTVYSVFTDLQKKTWLFTSFGLFHLDKESKRFLRNHSEVCAESFFNKSDLFWSDENTGVHIIRSKGKEILNIKTPPGNYIGAIFIDSQNTIWTGSCAATWEDIGLTRFIETPDLIKHYFTEKNRLNNQHLVLPVLKDKFENIWVGTKGLSNLFRVNGDEEIEEIDFLIDYSRDEDYRVKSMVKDSTGIWMGCTNNLLVYYSHSTQKFTYYPLFGGKTGQPDIGIHNILKEKNRIIINAFNNQVGSRGIYSFDIAKRKLTLERPTDYPCKCILPDRNGGFWVGSIYSTVLKLDSAFNLIDQYKIGDGDNLVEHICQESDDVIWTALMGGGLGSLNLNTREVKIYSRKEGLASNTLCSILKDSNNRLWISTSRGISCFDLNTKTFRNIGKGDGLLINDYNSDAFYQAASGEMYFGGVGGMVSFHPDSIVNNLAIQNKCRLVITRCNVSGMPCCLEKPIYKTDTIKLKKGDNNFQLSFVKLDFKNPEKIRYRYRLKEENSTWIETDYRHRDINYANLAPGNYNLEIEATNTLGEWDVSRALSIVIPLFFYETLWFKLFVFFLLVIVVALLIMFYNRQIRLEAKQKHDELRLESLRGQMNPHFIFNSLNSINYFISKNDKLSANNYIADFSRLIRSFLSNLSSEYIPLKTELCTLEDYLKLEHLRFNDKFNYEIRVDLSKKQKDVLIFPGMVQPFIENAIWHGVRNLENRKGSILIKFVWGNPACMKCIIEDDGVGRKQSEKYKDSLPGKKSCGIGIVMERLKIASNSSEMNYTVNIEDLYPNKRDSGTRVIVKVPIRS